jgi:hypothetical protein
MSLSRRFVFAFALSLAAACQRSPDPFPPAGSRMWQMNCFESIILPAHTRPADRALAVLDEAADLAGNPGGPLPETRFAYTVPAGHRAVATQLCAYGVRMVTPAAFQTHPWASNDLVWQLRLNGRPLPGFERVNHAIGSGLGVEIGNGYPAARGMSFVPIHVALNAGDRLSAAAVDTCKDSTAAVIDLVVLGYEWPID